MTSTTLLLNGFSIIGDPQTNSNASNGGEFMIHDGTAVFEGDDIVVFIVENTDDGKVTDASYITGVIVYDNVADYYNDIPKYTYSGTADIDEGRNYMGDRYLEFDASDLTSDDPDAPTLDTLAVVAGVDILGTLETDNPYEVPTTEDIDADGDGTITGNEEGDASFDSDLINDLLVLCFARGTLIDTPDGPRFIETLREGDLVSTLDDGPQPIRWIGAQRMDGRGANAPIRIRRGALGNIRDLRVSPNHRMLLRGARAALLFGSHEVLVAAKHLVDGVKVTQETAEYVDYFHFLFDSHQIVFAEGCATESLFPGPVTLGTLPARDRDEILAHFPDLGARDVDTDLRRYELKRYEATALLKTA